MNLRRMKLGEIVRADRRIVLPNTKEANERPYLGLDQVEAQTGRILSYESSSEEGKSTTFAFDTKHVLYGKLRPYLNKVALPARAGRCTTEIIPLLPRGVDRDFLAFRLRNADIVTAAMSDKTGSRMPRADMNALLGFDLVIPKAISDQRRITAWLKAQLAATEQARQAAQAQVAETEALRLAIYREAFADIVPVAVPPAFDAAPAGWRWAKLGDIARLESGHTPSRARTDWWGGDVSWLSLTEIRALDGQWVDETRLRTNAAGIAHSAARILPRGTVCFSRTASVGFVAIMGKPMATSQDFANWVCGEELEPEFLMHALVRARTELRALATGATHKTIYMPTLKAFHLCLPGRVTQQRIIAELSGQLAAVEQMRVATQAQRADIEALPARVLAQAFQVAE